MLTAAKRIASLASAFTLLLTATAIAEDVTVPANKESAIGFHAAVGKLHCAHTGKPTIKVVKAPQHGTLRFEWTSITFNGKTTTNDTMSCKGKPIRGMAIYYRPDKGFRGEDYVKIGMTRSAYYMGSSAGKTDVLQGKITVK